MTHTNRSTQQQPAFSIGGDFFIVSFLPTKGWSRTAALLIVLLNVDRSGGECFGTDSAARNAEWAQQWMCLCANWIRPFGQIVAHHASGDRVAHTYARRLTTPSLMSTTRTATSGSPAAFSSTERLSYCAG